MTMVRNNKKSAFTLLETIVTLSIMASVTAASYPYVIKKVQQNSANKISGELTKVSEGAQNYHAREGAWPDQTNLCVDAIDTLLTSSDIPKSILPNPSGSGGIINGNRLVETDCSGGNFGIKVSSISGTTSDYQNTVNNMVASSTSGWESEETNNTLDSYGDVFTTTTPAPSEVAVSTAGYEDLLTDHIGEATSPALGTNRQKINVAESNIASNTGNISTIETNTNTNTDSISDNQTLIDTNTVAINQKADLDGSLTQDFNAQKLTVDGDIVTTSGVKIENGDVIIPTGEFNARKANFEGDVEVDGENAYGVIEVGGAQGAYIDLKSPLTDDYDIRMITTGSGGVIENGLDSGDIKIRTNGSNSSFVIDTGGNNERMRITSSGNVGIGVTPQGKLQVDGSILVRGNGAAGTLHGIRLLTGDSAENGGEIQVLNHNGEPAGLIDLIDGADPGDGYGVLRFLNLRGNVQIGTTSSYPVSFITGGIERLRITSSGNVGINTTTPTEKLEVNGNIKATSFIGDGSGLTGVAGGAPYDNGILTVGNASNMSKIIFEEHGSENAYIEAKHEDAQSGTTPNSGYSLHVGSNQTSTNLVLNGAGKFVGDLDGTASGNLTYTDAEQNFVKKTGDTMTGILTLPKINATTSLEIQTKSTNAITIDNSQNTTFHGNITVSSDKRIKSNIKTLEGTLSKLMNIRGVSYVKKDSNLPEIGVIAQEVENQYPELIRNRDDGIKTVNYNGLIGVLIESVKQLSSEVNILRSETHRLRNEIKTLNQRR